MKIRISFVIFILFIYMITVNISADTPRTPEPKQVVKKDVPAPIVTDHVIKIKGKLLKYRATTGYMEMKDESDKQQALVFYIAYTKTGTDKTNRPITFTFNGGPGSSAVWLHMGGLGPKRVKMSDDGISIPPPYRYLDNENTWLEFTDLVFIDPVSTGYSRPAPEVEKKKFHGVKEDVKSVGDFIRLYITQNERWISPKFLCGESYGTTRAAGLSGYLQETYGVFLKGIVFVSSVLHFQNSRFRPGNDLPYALFLPTYTSSAWYHKKLPPKYQKDLQATLREVEQWALGEYLQALAKGDRLPENERRHIIDKLASYTGLSREYIDNTNLRILIYRFVNELLRNEKQMVGRLDSRFKTEVRDAANEYFEFDPSMAVIDGPFAAVINHYIRTDLGYKNDLHYEWITDNVRPWNWNTPGGGEVNVGETLRSAMSQNKYLQVLVACGYYDLATPYFAADYTFNHLGLAPSLMKNIVFKYYEAGHMMYINKPSMQKLREDVFEFYQKAIK
jgi:carboxypeptidase C (cathepsin A)